ncbi:DUF2058 domain-containing protein [Pseudomarimonas salicorniae]|uniref:DUF2058 family protein n=1 Tax=Pseudomarimonas salicorniae TaxID=2933270 RepID=A0ABT0GK01_9GAMM|nr:DUF2058 family protein [Lysobacter sp. CAU 1642]MCK7594858.1 DUF2058 family protein [Lysobacter sp. CAU 1642]
MSNSLRDQLLGLGFKAPPKPERAPRPKPGASGAGKPGGGPGGKQGRPGKPGKPPRKPRPEGDIDLAKAYAIRAQREKDERIAAEQARQEAARKRREARAALSTFLAGKALNDKDAEIARHFEYGGKIKRIYVNAEQLKALNAGELGVVQDNGRYLLVSAEHLAEAERIFAEAVALKVDPNAPAADDPYADPKYQIPDDLVW